MNTVTRFVTSSFAALGLFSITGSQAIAAYTPLSPILDLPNGSFQTAETQIYPYPGSSANYVGTTDYAPANDAFNFEPVFFGLDQGFGYYIKPGNNATPAMTLSLYHKAVGMDGTSDTLTGLGGQLVKGEVASLIDGIAPTSSEWFLRFLDSGNNSLGETTKAITYSTVYANGYTYGTADELPISAIAPVGATQVELGIRQNFPAANFSDQISFRTDWFRLDIIPEPGSMTLAGIGALVLLWRRRV